MMEIEIDDGDALRAVNGLRMKSRNSSVVEQAEAHRFCDFGMMAGRPDAAKRIVGFALHHFIDTADRSARSAQGRFPASGGDDGISLIERDEVVFRLPFFKQVDIGPRVRPRHLVGRRHRSFNCDQVLEPRVRQGLLDRLQPLRPFRVPLSCVMIEKGRVRYLQRGHGSVSPCLFADESL
jgi:hypothetical protein